MGGWNAAWPTQYKAKLKGLGLTDGDIATLMKTKNFADVKKLADPMIKKHADKQKAIKDALNQALPGLNWH